MENLQYVIEDRTIAELLGIQNFTNDESAVLELVKNAYDAGASMVNLDFFDTQLVIRDNGCGMDYDNIKKQWMHVGKSLKQYSVSDYNNKLRVLAGSKGIGRFALARLGESACIYTKTADGRGVRWETDWASSTLSFDDEITDVGTVIVIYGLRAKWNSKKIKQLKDFLSKTYNDDAMTIVVTDEESSYTIEPYFPERIPGINCLSAISLKYDCITNVLMTKIDSDEFLNEANKYCSKIDINSFIGQDDMFEEFKSASEWDLPAETLKKYLTQLGDFTAELTFSITPSKVDVEKFLYKHCDLPGTFPSGVILYRNAFSISSYEGKKDWLGFGKRSRKSPAAASHPTGAWRVRENQIAGKVEIDKLQNAFLQDLSNRQGLDENIYYELFVEIILTGVKAFERYRQDIIRQINVKNAPKDEEKKTPIYDIVVSNPRKISELTLKESKQLITEIKQFKKAHHDAEKEKENIETRYKYDVRILNVLATVGLKASSIAHEMKNDRNTIAENIDNIIDALKEFDMWEELSLPEKTAKSYQNVPFLLQANKNTTTKLVAFMNTMLSEIEKKQFEASWQSVSDILEKIKTDWKRDYAWIDINLHISEDICFLISEDYLRVVFDNLILNSIQQNEKENHLTIDIAVKENAGLLIFSYSDNGKGLDKKYLSNPRKILEVHETSRKDGHGLGMWIVNNTVVMSGGNISDIRGNDGFAIDFSMGDTNK